MRASVSPKMKVKSAGGVKNLDMLLEFMDAGVDRSGQVQLLQCSMSTLLDSEPNLNYSAAILA